MTSRRTALLRASIAASVTSLAACSGAPLRADGAASAPVVREAFLTPCDSADNVDGPAVWHGPDGRHWLLSTAKSSDVVLINDAATGAAIGHMGGSGTAAGQLRRPNGITVIGAVMLVVERDNHRVQAFSLPRFATLGTFGDSLLRLPYGIGWYEEAPGRYMVYVTDNYERPDESVPPDRELGERVKQFRLSLTDGRLSATHVRSFGDTAGAGVLRVVESIAADAANDRLLIAEETETDSYIKVYDLAGRFTGQVFGRGHFPRQAEGIALYACGDRDGYWIATDQGDDTNTYHVFDRMSFEHLAAFTGEATRRTDGVVLTQVGFGAFPAGAFYASHLDGGIGALSWAAIARAIGLRDDCGPRAAPAARP
ncbi:MAG TPA: phytase [Gemmatimonadaceae bacterium]|nr:phytase [Gemmatimonadaceae bacterium]